MNDPLNILMLTHKSKMGSGPRSHAMARELVKHGHQVSIMLISPTRHFGFTEYDWDGVHMIETPDMLWNRFRTGWDPWDSLNRIIYLTRQKTSYDLIHCYETRPSSIYPALFLSAKNHIPLLTDWNDWWGRHGLIEVNRPSWYSPALMGWIETYYEETFRAGAAGLTVITSALAQRAIELGVDPRKICIIPGGASLEKFTVRSKEECRYYANIPAVESILGFSSADSHLDLEIIMASMNIVAQKYPGVKLLITGSIKPEVLKMIAAYDLQDKIISPGFLSDEDFPWYLGCADIFLLPMQDRPYNRGRWPNKMGDYLSLGRPTVSNPVGDIKALFERQEVGLLADWTAEDFAAKIIYLLDHPEIAEKISQNARQVAENEYNWEILGKKVENFYYKTLERESHLKNTTKSAYVKG